jgi:hypothetical protein
MELPASPGVDSVVGLKEFFLNVKPQFTLGLDTGKKLLGFCCCYCCFAVLGIPEQALLHVRQALYY